MCVEEEVGFLLYHSLLVPLSVSWNPELDWQPTNRNPPLCPSPNHTQPFHLSAGDLNSVPHSCPAIILTHRTISASLECKFYLILYCS